MKFTMSWLRDHLDTAASLDEITEALTDLGLEVEGVENPAAALAPFSIARVIEATQHPNADRLRVCRVETWPNGPDQPSAEVQVVCGAPNARTGLVGVFAPPGTHVPGTGVDLKPGVIRGVESNGMLCSERELMLSDDHDGIIDLAPDTPLGIAYADFAGLDDAVIEIAITPNRPDALGVAGVARDLAARGLGRIKTPAIAPVPGAFPCPVPVTLAGDVADKACPVFFARLIRGVVNGPSPEWLQRRLRAIGLRPISALVDVTNYLTYDRARPLHVFDADKVQGGLTVRLSRQGETLTGLDEKDYAFDDTMCVIADENAVESIGGVMGGLATGCTEATVNVLVEAAYFDPIRTAATGRKLKINSDARYRFERGVDPTSARDGIEMATRLILDLCGGEPSEVQVSGAVPDTARSCRLDPNRVVSLVGMDIPVAEQRRILTALGFEVGAADADGAHAVAVPSWRPDVHGEADLVEEIARVASLTKLVAAPLPRRAAGVARPVLSPMQTRQRAARRALAGQGLVECVHYTFVGEDAAALFGGGGPLMHVANPISSEMNVMRPSALPGLLEAAARNQARGFGEVALFEVGPAFHGPEPGEQAVEAALIRTGQTVGRHWSAGRRPVDAYDAKADAEAALAAIGLDPAKLMVARDAPAWFHPGRSGVLKLGPKVVLAALGELHPSVIAALDVKGPAVAATVFLEAAPFPRAKGPGRQALVVSDLQSVERDFAFVVPERVEAETALRAARASEKKLIASAAIFDVFEGTAAEAQFGAGMKSLALTVRLQPTAKTLTETEIDAVAAKVVEAVTKATGGTLRS
ncbi:MAG: phenylalanine--tRNA ligase subunit beta [Pseudomonadota bacterium]